MTTEQFRTYKEQTFDAYITKVIRNAAIDAERKIEHRAEHEISLSSLAREQEVELAANDKYNFGSIRFSVRGDDVTVNDILLGQAIASLPPHRREIILLSYFMNKNDPQIAELLHTEANTVRYRKHAALRRLRKLLEGISNE